MIRPRGRAAGPRLAAGQLKALVGDQPAFIEGLLLGAMVGAAIAGSTVWARFRDRRRPSGENRSAADRRSPN